MLETEVEKQWQCASENKKSSEQWLIPINIIINSSTQLIITCCLLVMGGFNAMLN